MKTIKKIGLSALGILTLLIVVGLIILFTVFPKVDPAPSLKVTPTPEKIARGAYLANSVNVCMDCHSERNWEEYSGPLAKGTEGMGGEIFAREFGFPGIFYSKNITPYGLKDWTDGEIYRTITTGVDKDGNVLFPVMPFHLYNQMHDDDIHSIIAYLRTLEPIESTIPEREVDFPFNLIMRTLPGKRAEVKEIPSKSNPVAYGAYLTSAASCIECHTPVKNGKMVEGLEFSGGREFAMPGGMVRSSNLTPDKSGLGSWSKEQFIHTFKQYQDSTYVSPKLSHTDLNTIMPWMMYSSMTEEDLGAIYTYLQTLPAINNQVQKFRN
jgi:hypothetical protein